MAPNSRVGLRFLGKTPAKKCPRPGNDRCTTGVGRLKRQFIIIVWLAVTVIPCFLKTVHNVFKICRNWQAIRCKVVHTVHIFAWARECKIIMLRPVKAQSHNKHRMKKIPGLLSVFTALSLAAAEPAATNAPAAKNEIAAIPDATHKPVLITNAVTIAGERVIYTAETGMLPVLKADGTSRASVFYVAYTRTDGTNHAARPVTFCFNGGPGSAPAGARPRRPLPP